MYCSIFIISRYNRTMMSYRQLISLLSFWLGFAVIMNMLRLFITEVPSYIWMNWNVFLAMLPLAFVWLFEKMHKKYLKAVCFLGWLFFLPNAPYMVTDLIHLRNVGPEWMLWFDGMMIFSYTIIGVAVFAYSLLKMSHMFTSMRARHWFMAGVSVLSAFGIYLGRYIRWNTWDIVTRPIHLFNDIVRILSEHHSEPVFILTMVFFTGFMMVSVWSGKRIFSPQISQ